MLIIQEEHKKMRALRKPWSIMVVHFCFPRFILSFRKLVLFPQLIFHFHDIFHFRYLFCHFHNLFFISAIFHFRDIANFQN